MDTDSNMNCVHDIQQPRIRWLEGTQVGRRRTQKHLSGHLGGRGTTNV